MVLPFLFRLILLPHGSYDTCLGGPWESHLFWSTKELNQGAVVFIWEVNPYKNWTTFCEGKVTFDLFSVRFSLISGTPPCCIFIYVSFYDVPRDKRVDVMFFFDFWLHRNWTTWGPYTLLEKLVYSSLEPILGPHTHFRKLVYSGIEPKPQHTFTSFLGHFNYFYRKGPFVDLLPMKTCNNLIKSFFAHKTACFRPQNTLFYEEIFISSIFRFESHFLRL